MAICLEPVHVPTQAVNLGPKVTQTWLLRWRWLSLCGQKEGPISCCKGQLCIRILVPAQQCSVVLDTVMFMRYSWGIGAKVANDSMRSAATTLAEYANKGGVGDRDG